MKLNNNFFISFKFGESENQSLSVLTYIPVKEDDGTYLTCRAENPNISNSIIEDKWRLSVHCEYFSINLIKFT